MSTGNKRVAFKTLSAFLGLNGLDLEVSEPEVVGVMTSVAEGSLREEDLAAWIRTYAVPG